MNLSCHNGANIFGARYCTVSTFNKHDESNMVFMTWQPPYHHQVQISFTELLEAIMLQRNKDHGSK